MTSHTLMTWYGITELKGTWNTEIVYYAKDIRSQNGRIQAQPSSSLAGGLTQDVYLYAVVTCSNTWVVFYPGKPTRLKVQVFPGGWSLPLYPTTAFYIPDPKEKCSPQIISCLYTM